MTVGPAAHVVLVVNLVLVGTVAMMALDAAPARCIDDARGAKLVRPGILLADVALFGVVFAKSRVFDSRPGAVGVMLAKY